MRLTQKQIVHTWWPLAASWLLMSLESPSISAVVSRMENPAINLAAYGGLVFPLSLIIEAPVIMLLAASTALVVDHESYRKIYRFMNLLGFGLTLLHGLVAFTPLYDLIVHNIFHSPPEIIEPARFGLRFMLPWTWSIAYRRFQQGVMIRFNDSRGVSECTMVRLITLGLMLGIGFWMNVLPGIAVGAMAQGSAVLAEAIYAHFRVRRIVKFEIEPLGTTQPFVWKTFYKFYIPLVLTSFLTLIWAPIGSAALSRMPLPVESLAAWQVISGLIFMLRSPGTAFNEVVVAKLGLPDGSRQLLRFTVYLILGTTAVHLLFAFTPLSMLWLVNLTGVPAQLLDLSIAGIKTAILLPSLTALVSWYQGSILHSRSTRAIPESVLIFLGVIGGILLAGIRFATGPGLFYSISALTAGTAAQVGWMILRSRRLMKDLKAKSEAELAALSELPAS